MPDIMLNELKRVFERKADSDIIDLDEKITIKHEFSVSRLEDWVKAVNFHLPPIKWSYYRIYFVTSGQADAIHGIHKFKVQKNMVALTAPRLINTSINWSEDTRGYLLRFKPQFFLQNNFPIKLIESKKIFTPSVKPFLVVSDEQAEELSALFETMISESDSANDYKNELIALKIIELLIISERLFADEQRFETNLPSMDIIKRFINLMEAHFLNQHSVSFYATRLNMHPNYLNSLVKKYTGLTAKDSIQNRIILETKYLLHSTNLSIKEISYKLGFEDPNYFTVFFKKAEKLSPLHYRSSFI
jgi:AraC family transcriptional activator of pobA